MYQVACLAAPAWLPRHHFPSPDTSTTAAPATQFSSQALTRQRQTAILETNRHFFRPAITAAPPGFPTSHGSKSPVQVDVGDGHCRRELTGVKRRGDAHPSRGHSPPVGPPPQPGHPRRRPHPRSAEQGLGSPPRWRRFGHKQQGHKPRPSADDQRGSTTRDRGPGPHGTAIDEGNQEAETQGRTQCL